jgi:hypothetical protein
MSTIIFGFKLGEKVKVRNHEERYVNAVIKSQVDKDHYLVSCIDTIMATKRGKDFNQLPNFIDRTFHRDDLYPFELTQTKLWGVLD